MRGRAFYITVGLIFTSIITLQHQAGVGIINQARAASGQAVPSGPHGAHENGTTTSKFIVTRDYIIGPEDMLEITVWKNQDLSKQVQVRPDGRISLPLIGDVQAAGFSPKHLKDEISRRLEAYMENPVVSILVQEVKSYAIYVLGAVASPGKFPLKTRTRLLQAITLAGGFTPLAARNKIVIFRIRQDGEEDEKIKASYDDIVMRGGIDQNVELKPGDTIVVPSETMVVIP